MDKSTLLLAAIILAVFGTSVTAGHPAWGTFAGVAIILLAAGLAAGTLPLHARDFLEERTAPSQRISKSLITLSSAAIVSIYAAGYHRTDRAAHKFDLQIPQPRTPISSATVTAPAVANPENSGVGPSASVAPPAIKRSASRKPNTVRKQEAAKSNDSSNDSTASSEAAGAKTAVSQADDQTPSSASGQQLRYKDGVYLGWGSCRHGDIEASVTIQEGKIASVAISQCLTRYSCNWIAPRSPNSGLPDLPAQVVERQSTKVDYVSGATESSYAFADAVVAALSKATE